MSDLAALFTRAIERFVDRVSQVDDAQWSLPTPCSEWDVRTLVNHIAYEQLWAPHLVAGETIEQVGDRYDGDVLGAEPLATLRTAASGSTAAFAAADLDAVVHLSFADLPCREYLLQMLTDAEVHGWDLATALGQDRTLDAEVVDVLLPSVIEQQDLIRGSGMFGAEVPVAADADPAARLLALLGRE